MDKNIARNLSEALKTHLESFEEEHDIKITLGSGKFDNTTLTLKVELAELAESGEALTRSANEFKTLARSYGLNPEDLGREFKAGTRTYRIIGLKPRSTRYPILAESDGKRYKFAVASVQLSLNKGKPVAKRPDKEIIKDLQAVENGLSPENLCCDGEASANQIRWMSANLNEEKRKLIAELGRQPTAQELWVN